MTAFSQTIEQERQRWMSFRRALAKEDQAAFDNMFDWAKEQLQAEVHLGRPLRFEVVLMDIFL
jgi:hypothetical protein